VKCEICTLSSLMKVSRILQLFSPLSLNVTILRLIYDGILDNLSMPSILVHVLVYLTTKSTMTEIIWNIQGAGLTGGKIKSGVRFTHERVKRTQIADPERTQSGPRANAKFLKANAERTQGASPGFARVLGCVRSVLYMFDKQ
jgi:hypothetical protein